MATSRQQKLESLMAAHRSPSSVSKSSVLSVSSATLAQAMTTIDNGKGSVVIDIGHKFTKIGGTGELVPRSIIRTEFLDKYGNLITSNDIFALNNQKTIVKTYNFYYDCIKHFIEYIFHKILTIMPSDRTLVFVESIFMSVDMRNTISKIVLEDLQCKSVMFMPSHVCATIPFAAPTSLVIDIGHMETLVISIAEGVTMLNESETASSMCGMKFEKRVRELLTKYATIEESTGEKKSIEDSDWKFLEAIKIVDTIMLNSVCVSREKAQEWKSYDSNEEKTKINEKYYNTNGRTVIIPIIVFEMGMEIFFDEELTADCFEKPLPHIIFKVIENCAIDVRKKLLPNITVSGGIATVDGFLERLKEEINVLAAARDVKYADEVMFFYFKDISYAPMFISWLGASLLGSLRDTVDRKSLKLEDWTNGTKPSDWADIMTQC